MASRAAHCAPHDPERFVCMALRISFTAVLRFPFHPLAEDTLAPMGSCAGKSEKELPYVVACPSSYEVRVRWREVGLFSS